MRLGLGSTPFQLQDGFTSWNASAADAVAVWNGHLNFIAMSAVSSSAVPQRSGDHLNSVFFSSTVFGESFGSSTLAITAILRSTEAGSRTEADVIVNSAHRYNSYRGRLLAGGVYDIHRIFLHEFGHVLGLSHDDSHPLATKIMESLISDWDHLSSDDVAGAKRLYSGRLFNSAAAQTSRIGYVFGDFFQLTETDSTTTSFSAIGLPPGITLDPIHGLLNGTPTRSGVFNSVITAHCPFGQVEAGLKLTVLGPEEIPGLLKVIPSYSQVLLADPIRPRIYVAGANAISMIDTRNFVTTPLASGFWADTHLSISADSSTLLWTSSVGPHGQEHRIDLQSLDILPSLTLPGYSSAVLEGLNNQAYVAGFDIVYQIDATTGVLQQSFAPPVSTSSTAPMIAISPDHRTLYVARASMDGDLSSYDISSQNPVLLEQFSGYFESPVPSPDGQHLYYTTSNAGIRSLKQARLPSLNPVRLVSSSSHLGLSAVAPNASIYRTIVPAATLSGSYSVYDPVTLHQTVNVVTDDFIPEAQRPDDYFQGIAVDNTGRYVFAIVNSYLASDIWILSTDPAAYPRPVHPTKNLLNISTRGKVEAGENTMIGGFIVQGNKPKKLLIRGLGASLPITGAMDNPVLDLYDSAGRRLVSNDNWISNRLNVIGTLLAPSSSREAALLVTLQPGAYTAILRDFRNQPGLGLVEVYDLDTKNSRLVNISTRGKVGTADNVLIGGLVIGGKDPTKILIRAIGPSLARHGIQSPLVDPVLELHDGTGRYIFGNDNWRTSQASTIFATGLAPTDNRESAMVVTLQPGSYTAIVRGKGSASGVALVEVYNLEASPN